VESDIFGSWVWFIVLCRAKGSEIKSLGESIVQLRVDVPDLLKAHADYADKDVEVRGSYIISIFIYRIDSLIL
jgi:hypothetical protein